MTIWFYYFEILVNQYCSFNTCRSQHMLESKQEIVSGVRLHDLVAVTPKTRVFWDVRLDDLTAVNPKTRVFWDVRLNDLTTVTPKTRVFWDGNIMFCCWVNSFGRM